MSKLQNKFSRIFLLTFLLLLAACSNETAEKANPAVASTATSEQSKAQNTTTATDSAQPVMDSNANSMDGASGMDGGNGMGGGNSMDGSAAKPAAAPRNSGDDGSESGQSEDDADESGQGQRYVDILASYQKVADFLANEPGWRGEADFDSDSQIWWIDLYNGEDEWIGYGSVELPSEQIGDYFVPRNLSDAEFNSGKAAVETLILSDAEVMALLGDLSDWAYETEYDRWDESWYMAFYQNRQEWVVRVPFWENDNGENEYYIDEIYDPSALSEEEADEWAREQAVELAYEAAGIWEALDGVEEWVVFAEPQGDTRWSVSFVNKEGEHFYALVDIDIWQVLETKP